MDKPRILILGGGFAGLTVANELLNQTGTQLQISIVDKNEYFSMGANKLWVLAGYRKEAAKRSRKLLSKKGIQFLKEEIIAIHVDGKNVETKSEILSYDYLVVALGAEPVPSLIPGLSESGFNLYSRDDIPPLKEAITEFQGGKVVVFIGTPYKCPPAPYEGTIIVDELLRKGGVRELTTIDIYTAQPIALPIAGKEISEKFAQILNEREIDLHFKKEISRIDATTKTIFFPEGDPIHFDLLIGIPPHRPPRVVTDSQLTSETPWISVNPKTLQTAYENVFALGDVAAVMLPNGKLLPKAGTFAELEGLVVAKNISSKVNGMKETAAYDGTGYCFAELGPRRAAYMKGEFFAEPSPLVTLEEVSQEGFEKKEKFEEERLERWFSL